MPVLLKEKLQAQSGVRNPYAVMNAMGAMRGSDTTDKGRRIEAKLRRKRRNRPRNYEEAGDALAGEDLPLPRSGMLYTDPGSQ